MMSTYIIIAVTVIVSIMAFSNAAMFYKLSLNPYSIVHQKQWYRVISHGFVHGDYTHLLINMLVFWSFGVNVEMIFNSLQIQDVIGNATTNFLVLYFGALIFSSVPDIISQKNNVSYNSIGASGAVSAVLFASIFFAPWSKIYFMAIVPIPSILFGVFYIWYEQYMSKRGGGNINHKAHIYGAIFGVLYPILMKPSLLGHFINQLINIKF